MRTASDYYSEPHRIFCVEIEVVSRSKDRVLCMDAKTGKEIWKHEYDRPYTVQYGSGPRVTPTVKDGKVYTLGGMGDLCCIDAKKGTPVWHKDLMKDHGIASPQVW